MKEIEVTHGPIMYRKNENLKNDVNTQIPIDYSFLI